MRVAESWISAETEPKEADFRGILNMHMSIAKAIIARQAGPPYLYVDLYAGPGRLAFRGKEFDGSPLIFMETANQLGVQTVSAFYEQGTADADRLKGALASAGASGHFEVHAERCQDGFPKLLQRIPRPQGGRYGLVYSDLDLPPNAWVGTSVDEQKRVRIAEDAFRKIDGVKHKWLSLEPLREPLEFTDLSMFDWVVIGAQTATHQPDGPVAAFAPPFEWVARLTVQALDAGCKVHLKPNLWANPGMARLDEYPGEADAK